MNNSFSWRCSAQGNLKIEQRINRNHMSGTLFNIYCDESCHLESGTITPENRFMVLGGVMCSAGDKDEIFKRIKTIKKEGGIGSDSEIKWTKVSKGKLETYKDLINYFFDCGDLLSFRGVVIDKSVLDHNAHNQNHDQFYYKMYFQVLDWFFDPSNKYHIYLDIKDTLGALKIKKLQEVLCNSNHDFDQRVISRTQEIRSHEVVLSQITDLLIGAISYANRYPDGGKSEAKNEIIKLIRERSGVSLCRSTSLGARKFNIFCWEGR